MVGVRGARTLIVGVGGATSSGKTTLAKQLVSILQPQTGDGLQQQQQQARPVNAVILHQDDFALPEEQLPFARCGNEDVRDWDHPRGTIDYKRFATTLQHARDHGSLPPHHSSHDHLNEQGDRPILPPEQTRGWQSRLAQALQQRGIEHVVIADGFLLYYDEGVRRQLDVRLFLRCTRETLVQRRSARGGYATAEGTVWQDPPTYFDDVVWPAYILAHRSLFEGDDVEHGALVKTGDDAAGDGKPVCNLVMLDSDDDKSRGETSMEAIVEAACEVIERHLLARETR